MFPSKVLMDKVFGNLAHVRGLLTYRLSPHELKPFAGAFSKGGPNVIPRTTSTLMTWLPGGSRGLGMGFRNPVFMIRHLVRRVILLQY